MYGRGEAALPALFAGLLHPRVSHIALDSFLCSFESLATGRAPAWRRYQYLPDVLTHFDLPQLFRRRTDKRFLLANPLDADKQRLDEMDALRLYGLDNPHIAVHVEYEPRSTAGVSRRHRGGWHQSESSSDGWRAGGPDRRNRQDIGDQRWQAGSRDAAAHPDARRGLDRLERVAQHSNRHRHQDACSAITGWASRSWPKRWSAGVREKFGVRHALAVTSGSAALSCALAGLGMGRATK